MYSNSDDYIKKHGEFIWTQQDKRSKIAENGKKDQRRTTDGIQGDLNCEGIAKTKNMSLQVASSSVEDNGIPLASYFWKVTKF
jgi:hypothetical protein